MPRPSLELALRPARQRRRKHYRCLTVRRTWQFSSTLTDQSASSVSRDHIVTLDWALNLQNVIDRKYYEMLAENI